MDEPDEFDRARGQRSGGGKRGGPPVLPATHTPPQAVTAVARTAAGSVAGTGFIRFSLLIQRSHRTLTLARQSPTLSPATYVRFGRGKQTALVPGRSPAERGCPPVARCCPQSIGVRVGHLGTPSEGPRCGSRSRQRRPDPMQLIRKRSKHALRAASAAPHRIRRSCGRCCRGPLRTGQWQRPGCCQRQLRGTGRSRSPSSGSSHPRWSSRSAPWRCSPK